MKKRNYNLGLFRQIEELTLRFEASAREVVLLREENRLLREACESIRVHFTAELEKAHAEIERLKAQLNKNSSNSSKPPSQDGPQKVPSLREKSERPRGGQPGHPGRSLVLPEELEKLLRDGLANVEDVDHTGGTFGYCDVCYELDLKSVLVIRRHFYPLGELPPEKRNRVTYGSDVKTLATYLSVHSQVSLRRVADLIRQLSHGIINLSDASIGNFSRRLARRLEPELERVRTDLLNGPVLHVDETPVDVTQKPDYSGVDAVMRDSSHTSFSACLRTHSNEQSTLLTVNPHKDKQGCLRDKILPLFVGILSHDHDSKFYNYGTIHATCNAHLLRELTSIAEQKIAWGDEMSGLLRAMNAHKDEDLKEGKAQCSPDMLASFEKQFDEMLENGRDTLGNLRQYAPGRDELRRIVARLTERKDCYLLFMRDYLAPFTNNQAERDLRPSKTKLKVSGCFRSWEGVSAFAAIQSFVSTVKKRSLNVFEAIRKAFASTPVLGY